MSETPEQYQKTEAPTQRRLEDARKKGDAPKSQEVTLALSLAGIALALVILGPMAFSRFAGLARGVFAGAGDIAVEPGVISHIARELTLACAIFLAGPAAVLMIAGVSGHLVQARPVFSTKKIAPDLKRISPMAGAKRLFGPQGLATFLKALTKLTIFGLIVGFGAMALGPRLFGLGGQSPAEALLFSRETLLLVLMILVLPMGVMAAADYAFQVANWKKRLRMTREELRRDQKETDGDPQVKGRQRQLRESRSRRRTMAAVKEATVVIMNPVHVAVALYYDPETGDAPVCTAKGMDALALRMRMVAQKNRVPVVENKPLARALHASTQVDAVIPVEHYLAVAKVIAFVQAKAAGPKAQPGS